MVVWIFYPQNVVLLTRLPRTSGPLSVWAMVLQSDQFVMKDVLVVPKYFAKYPCVDFLSAEFQRNWAK